MCSLRGAGFRRSSHSKKKRARRSRVWAEQVRREGGIAYVEPDRAGDADCHSGAQSQRRQREHSGAVARTGFEYLEDNVAGKERVILSPAELYFDRDRIHVRAQDPAQLKVGFLPALGATPLGLARDDDDGVFQMYSARAAAGVERGQSPEGAGCERRSAAQDGEGSSDGSRLTLTLTRRQLGRLPCRA